MGWLDTWRKNEESELLEPGDRDLDLTDAVVVFDETPRLSTYAEVLKREVFKRTNLLWSNGFGPTITLKVDPAISENPEAYTLVSSAEGVAISGATEVAVLFGIGRLLREMTLDLESSYSSPTLSSAFCRSDLRILSQPDYPMRQHQVAYRPKTNSYDAYSVEQMKQEFTELALFGCNAVEMIPPGLDDAAQSPHFGVSWLEMLEAASAWCDQLGLKVSLWFPAFQDSPEEQWETVFSSLRRLDALFVPGGDPGGRPPSEFFRIVEQQALYLRDKYFPKAEIWVSSQYGLGVSVDLGLERWIPRERLNEWMECLRLPWVEEFLTGVVYSPWTAMSIDEFCQNIPPRFKIRNYPDICHSSSCEFPVDGWDGCFAVSNLRESINPRPRAFTRIIQDQAPLTQGCGCYSEGINDDINKVIWSVLHWGTDKHGPLADATPDEVLDYALAQYASFLCCAPRHRELVKAAIYALEEHWSTALTPELSVRVQSLNFRLGQMENNLSPTLKRNWRINLLMLRAQYDAFIVTRFEEEKRLVDCAKSILQGSQLFSQRADKALAVLNEPYRSPAAAEALEGDHHLAFREGVWFAAGRLERLAANLFALTGYQSSVGYGGQHRQRGAFLDMAWVPLHEVQYWKRLLKTAKKSERGKHALLKALSRNPHTEPGVVWYGSFGQGVRPGDTPLHHVLTPHHKMSLGDDPTFFERPLVEHLATDQDDVLDALCRGEIPLSHRSWLVTLWPETARTTLSFSAQDWPDENLRVRVTYIGKNQFSLGGDWEELERQAQPTRLLAGGLEVHGWLDPPDECVTLEYELPADCLEHGYLNLVFEPQAPNEITVNNIAIPIAEVWILA